MEIQLVTVPTKSPEPWPPQAPKVASLISAPMKVLGVAPEVSKCMDTGTRLLEEAVEIQGYFSTIQEGKSKYHKLQEAVDSIRYEGLTLSKLGVMVVSTALIAKAYIIHYEDLTGMSASSLPLLDVGLPLYAIYTGGYALASSYIQLKEAKTSDEAYNSFFEFNGVISNLAYNALKLAAQLALFEISASVTLLFYSYSYASSIANVIQAENQSHPSLEDQYKTPPTIFKV